MNHITDFQLNEYLDHALDDATQGQCDSHLSSCAECRARLEELKGLYSNLAELREVELPRDLTSSVLAHLPQTRSELWTQAFAAQLGAALGMAVFIASELAKSIHIPPFPAFQISLPELRFTIPNFPSSIPESLFPFFRSLFSISHFSFPMFSAPSYIPQLPVFRIPLSSFQSSMIVIFTLLLGLIGNAILLCERSEVQK